MGRNRAGIDQRVLFRGSAHGAGRDRIVWQAGCADTDLFQHESGAPLLYRERVGEGLGNRHQRKPRRGVAGAQYPPIDQHDRNRQVFRVRMNKPAPGLFSSGDGETGVIGFATPEGVMVLGLRRPGIAELMAGVKE